MVSLADSLYREPLVGPKTTFQQEHLHALEPHIMEPISEVVLLAKFAHDRAEAILELVNRVAGHGRPATMPVSHNPAPPDAAAVSNLNQIRKEKPRRFLAGVFPAESGTSLTMGARSA